MVATTRNEYQEFAGFHYMRMFAAGVTLALVAFVAMANASAIGLFETDDDSATLLEIRMANMREVQHALATPLPPLAPLRPITARPAHALQRSLVAQDQAPSRTQRQPFELSSAAREAMAAIEPAPECQLEPTAPSYSYPAFDRHALR